MGNVPSVPIFHHISNTERLVLVVKSRIRRQVRLTALARRFLSIEGMRTRGMAMHRYGSGECRFPTLICAYDANRLSL